MRRVVLMTAADRRARRRADMTFADMKTPTSCS